MKKDYKFKPKHRFFMVLFKIRFLKLHLKHQLIVVPDYDQEHICIMKEITYIDEDNDLFHMIWGRENRKWIQLA